MKILSATKEHNYHPNYRPDIDGLRAIAILSVVIFHAFPASIRGGFVGVDIFFVISGFLISSIIFKSLQRDDFGFAEFYAHRVKRIFPALIIVLSASYIFGWFALMPDEFKQLGKHIAAGVGFVQNFVLWKEAGYFDTASELKPLMHLWSLAIEEQFYLFYPLLIWGAWRLGLHITFSIIVALGLLSFGLNIHGTGVDTVKTFFLPHTRFWELLVGAVLAYIELFKRIQLVALMKRCTFVPQSDSVLNNLLASIGLLLIVSSVIGLSKELSFPGWWALPPVIGSFLLIFAGHATWVNRKILANRPMILIGLISYPLYLWHWPILSFERIIESGAVSNSFRVAAIGLSILLAWITYKVIERPFRFGRKTWKKTAALCVLSILIGSVGYNTFVRNGLSFRVNKQLQGSLDDISWPENLLRESSCMIANPFMNHANNAFCQGNVETSSVLLTGDSHSNSLYPGLAEVYPGKILNLAGSACLPFFDVDSGYKNERPSCPYEDVNSFLGVASKYDNIKTVVIAFRGPLYIKGTGFGDAEANHYIRRKNSIDLGNYAEIFEQSMRKTLKILLEKNKKIVFVIDIPELGFDPKSCIDGKSLKFLSRVRKPCALPRTEYAERSKEYREIVLSVTKDFPSVVVFDAAAQLCDKQYCWAIKDGKMLYRDYDHLSLQGSRYIARELEKFLQLDP